MQLSEVTYLKIVSYSDHPDVTSAAEELVESFFANKSRRKDVEDYLRTAKKLIASLWYRGPNTDLFRFTTKDLYFSESGRTHPWMTKKVLKLFNQMRKIEPCWIRLRSKGIPPNTIGSGQGYSAIYCRTSEFKERLKNVPLDELLPDPDLPLVELKGPEDNLLALPTAYINSRAYNTTVSTLLNHFELLRQSNVCLPADKRVHPIDYRYVRKFRDDLEHGGRFYAPFVNYPKEQRKAIHFNGVLAASIDLSQLHPTLILRLTQGVDKEPGGLLQEPLPDAYEMPDYWFLPRAIHKRLVNTLINAKSEESAVRSLMTARWWVNEDNEYICKTYKGAQKRRGIEVFPESPKAEAEKYVALFKMRHPAFADAVCSGLGSRLQLLDSQLVENVIRVATEAGVPVLPVHDEFVFPSDRQSFMEILIQRSFQHTFGDSGRFGTLNCKMSKLMTRDQMITLFLDG
jgi:hypothetical protein